MSNLPFDVRSEGFLDLEPSEYPSYQDARSVIIPFGLEASVSYGKGTSKGPAAILAAGPQVELFDEVLWKEPHHDFQAVVLSEPAINPSLPLALDQLSGIVSRVLDDGKFPLVLGGEHAITAGSIRPFLQRYPDLAILHFDAHADLRDGYDGQHYSHAAALRRCLDAPHVTLVSCGIRNISAEEIPFLEANRHRIHMHWAKDKKNWDLNDIIAPLRGRPTYITFDVDGFDASLMPATGTPEPGGMFWDEALDIIHAACQATEIVGADVNELAPIPGYHACDFLAAKLVFKILGLTFAYK